MNAKIHRYLACGFLFIFFFGCTPTTSTKPTVTPTLLPVSTSSFTTIPSATVSAVPTANPPLHFFYPKVEKICPEKREISIDKLGITGDLKIILSDTNQTGLWTLDIENPSPQLIQKLPLDKWTSKSISPDGKRLAYTIWNPDHSLSTWLLSLDSGEQHEIININYLEGASSTASWLSQNELLIVGSCAGAGCPFPLKVVNIETGDSIDVSSINGDPYDEYQTFYEDAGKYYALYSKGNVGDDYIDFYIYDYLFHQKIRVFPWLQNRIFFYPYIGTNLQVEFGLNKTVMLVEQSYGFDVGVVDESVDSMTKTNPYDVVMKRIFANTGSHFDQLRYYLFGLNSVTNTLFLHMSYRDYIDNPTNNISDFKTRDIEDGFFSLDFQNVISESDRIDYLVFKDYCFTTTGYYFQDASPNGKILALSSDSDIAFLNLETGYISYLPHWRFIGWAKR